MTLTPDSSAHDAARAVFGRLDGAHIPGGCDHCNAYQKVRPVESGIWNLRTYHDEWCAWLHARQNRAQRRRGHR